MVSANIGRTDDARKYTEQAYALRDRVSEYERLYIEWSHATRVTNNRALARQTLEMMVTAYPGDYAARNNLGVLLMQIADFAKALEQYEAAMVIAPGEPLPISNAAYALLFLGRQDEAFAMADRALALRPDPNLAIARWSVAQISHHPKAAEFEAAARSIAAPQQLLFADANLSVWEGRLADYRRVIEQLLTQARGSGDSQLVDGITAGETLTMAVVQRGEWIPKAKALMKSDLPPQGVAQIAASLAVIGEIDSIRPWVSRLEKMDANDPQQFQPALVARALVLAADGRGRDGVALVDGYLAQNPRSMELHYYLGLVRERSGEVDDAIASYRLAVQSAHVLGPNPAVMAARLGLARLLKQKGDVTGATEHFDALLKQWAKADADFYMVQAVKAAR